MYKRSDKNWIVIAGPCAAESREQIMKCAEAVSKYKNTILRAGIWKPRTKAGSWQGVGDEALEWMSDARGKFDIAIATETKDEESLMKVIEYEFDLVWVGARNGMNYSLLEKIGENFGDKENVIILKRSMGADLDEWLGAAQYILKYTKNLILCERGIKGFPRNTRNVLDIQTAKLAQTESKLKTIVDLSHAAGRRDLVIPMSLAAKAAGFDGIMVEIHPEPDKAKTDSSQQLTLEEFKGLMEKLNKIPDHLA